MSETPTFETFVELMEAVILPRLHAMPGQRRLEEDAMMGKKAWDSHARFRYDGDVWEVYADNHYEPLLLAYWSAKYRGDHETFRRVETETRVKLELAEDLLRIRPTKAARMYLYRGPVREAA